MSAIVRPVDHDRDTGPVFAAARERRLIYRHCRSCDRGIHLPTTSCKHCGSTDTEWRAAAGSGHLYSWTIATNPAHPAYPVPYAIVVVALDEAPDVRLIGRVPGAPDLVAGQPMQLWFEDIGEGQILPQWAPAG
jgi:uncharacterized OB-fold protein